MPPEVLYFRPIVQFSPPFTNQPSIPKHWQPRKGMSLPKRKLIPILVLIISIISILRLLKLTIRTSPSPSGISSSLFLSSEHSTKLPNITNLSEKEFKLLSDLITLKSPCNLLIFGFQPQYLTLSSINAAGNTIFLEDDQDKITKVRSINSNNTQIHKVEYNMRAKSAYKLLKHARKNPECGSNPTLLQRSKCKLALRNLPQEVYKKKWDVIVVDGPSGDSAKSQGRMGSIYTASVLARKNNDTSDVVVHDVDRMIEKWFSWEFLCDENLWNSKGKLWHFRIRGHSSNSTTFCSTGPSTNELL